MSGLPAGAFRVRALDLLGRVTFASGVSVSNHTTAMLPARLWAKVDLDEPDSRQVMGFVRWESGLPVEKAAVIMQDSYNFRRYLRRIETDEHGYYHFTDVPGDATYFLFALPPGDEHAMRNFVYHSIAAPQREVWRDLALHPHRVKGNWIGTDPGSALQLVRIATDEERVVWSFHAEPSGQFDVANVPHGHYCVQVPTAGGDQAIRSLPFEVVDGKPAATVRWPSP